jgi:hypothetical protein
LILILRAESPKDISPGQSESASGALGSSQHEQQALKGERRFSMPKAQHPKVASSVRPNLFAGVTNFTELEVRIAAVPDEQSHGGAFEALAKA